MRHLMEKIKKKQSLKPIYCYSDYDKIKYERFFIYSRKIQPYIRKRRKLTVNTKLVNKLMEENKKIMETICGE